MKKRIGVTLILFISAGCASIIHGTNQRIKIRSSPEGARITVKGMPGGTTPAELSLPRGESYQLIRIEKEGYAPVEITLSREISGWFWGNFILFGGFWVGMLVDAIDGAMFKLEPSEINVSLKEESTQSGKTKVEPLKKALLASERLEDLAVIPVMGKGLPESVNTEFLWKIVIESCATQTSYRVMTKENVFVILRDKNIDPSKCSEAECAVEYGRILQADKLIVLEVNYIEGIYYVAMSLYDVSTASVENAISDECKKCNFNELVKLTRELTEKLIEVLKH